MTDFLYPPMVAYTAEGVILRSGSGQIFNEADTTYATPLTVNDTGGAPITTVAIDSLGVTQAFVATVGVCVWKSGDFILPLSSPTGLAAASAASQVAAEASEAAAEAAQAAAGASEAAAVALAAGLAGLAPLDSPGFTGTVTGITKAMVGLGSVDNTSDADKPVSTAVGDAIDALDIRYVRTVNTVGPDINGDVYVVGGGGGGVSTDAGNLLDVGTDNGAFLTLASLGISLLVPVLYAAGWPADRPTVPTGWQIQCIGDPGGSGPTWMIAGDLWTQG